jgi:hypothetical protein
MYDHHFGYIKNLKKKKENPWATNYYYKWRLVLAGHLSPKSFTTCFPYEIMPQN